MISEIKRGDIIFVDLNPVVGSEKGKIRPCAIIQNDVGNKYSPLTIVAVITSQKEISRPYPTDVWIDRGEGGLDSSSIIQCDQISTIDKKRIKKKQGSLTHTIMKKVNEAIKISLDLTEE